VTNPPMEAVPEQVRINAGPWGVSPWIEQRSSLVPLRQPAVMEWEADYASLYGLLVRAADRYVKITGREATLDLEFKKVAPGGRLLLKQIRPIPQASDKGYSSPLLLGRPTVYTTLQGRGGNVFTNHRLKSRWTLRPKPIWLTPRNLQECLYGDLDLEYVSEGRVRRISAPLSELPSAAHQYQAPQDQTSRFTLVDTWVFGDLVNPRTYRLSTWPLFQTTVPDPVVTAEDLAMRLEVDYERPVRAGESASLETEVTTLYRPWQPAADEAVEEFSFSDSTGLSIVTRFHTRWAFGPGAPTSIQFVETRIEGLTADPIVLRDTFSQSVGGGPHLCPKEFLFEPRLEPGISAAVLDELAAKAVCLIYLNTGDKQCRPTEVGDTDPYVRLYGINDPVCSDW